MDDFKITTTHDKRGILLRLSTEITFELNIVKEVNLNDISHPIIFNCFNEYDEIITEIKEKNIPIRIINLKLAKAINIKGTTFGKVVAKHMNILEEVLSGEIHIQCMKMAMIGMKLLGSLNTTSILISS